MAAPEDEHLEFKEARNSFPLEKLIDYCVALANERGGRIVLGVTDTHPRRVVGTSAFGSLTNTKFDLFRAMSMRVDAEEVLHPDGRVVVFYVPPRPAGTPLHAGGRYLMRSGGSLVSMTSDQIRRILKEIEVDFSATICHDAKISDLDDAALERFRFAWHRKTNNASFLTSPLEHLLSDAGLLTDYGLTYAALIFLGSQSALAKLLPQAEVIFEWRDDEARIDYQDRREFRRGLFLFLDELWSTINLRNSREQVRDGLFVREIPAFNESATREAILNAVAHRDYRAPGSVFVRQTPTSIEIESPGGFPPGVTPDNLLFKQVPRNRRLSESLSLVGLVERSGQGVDRMFETTIREGKEAPDFTSSDPYRVSVRMKGTIKDVTFLRFLEKISVESIYLISVSDLVVLDRVNRGQPIAEEFRQRARELESHGILERVGRTRGTRFILSKRFYEFAGSPGTYTRRRGLDRETNKELLTRHITANRNRGCSLRELMQVLPTLSRIQVKTLVQELKAEKRIHAVGVKKAALWMPGAETPEPT